MKKLWICILMISILFCFWGCGNGKKSLSVDKEKSTETQLPDAEGEDAQTDDSTSNEANQTDASGENESAAALTIETTYCSLTIPEEWRDRFSYEVTDEEDGSYYVGLYENTSHEIMDGGGWLFSVALLTSAVDYTNFPDYEVLGSVQTNDGKAFNVVVLYPTDVQFSEETATAYVSLLDHMDAVIASISYQDCKFSQAPISVEALQ